MGGGSGSVGLNFVLVNKVAGNLQLFGRQARGVLLGYPARLYDTERPGNGTIIGGLPTVT
jgi:hypothetical protein